MNRETYDAYLEHFHKRDYEGVLEHFTDDCEVVFAGYCFQGKQAVRDFYAFFHQHVDERIKVTHFVAGSGLVILETVVRLEGTRELSPLQLEARGLDRLVIPAPGQVVELPQFIHYHLSAGKFQKVLCAIFEPPHQVITRLTG